MTIEIEVLDAYAPFVQTERLSAAAAAALKWEGASGDITVVVTGDDAITDLNRRFLDEDGPTDVLSFPATDAPDSPFVLPPGVEPYLGDIVIAFSYTQRQAERLGRNVNEELELLVVHGVLHLLGYDHAEPDDERVMWARQEAILETLQAV